MQNTFRNLLAPLITILPVIFAGAENPQSSIVTAPSFNGRHHFDRYTILKVADIGEVMNMHIAGDSTFLDCFQAGFNNRADLANKDKSEVYLRVVTEKISEKIGLRTKALGCLKGD